MASSVVSRRALLRGVGLLVAGGAAAAACGPLTDSGPVARLRRAGAVRAGYAELAPYTSADPHDGAQTVGAAAALTAAAFAELGVDRIDWRRRELRALVDELRAGRIDLIATPLPVGAVDCAHALAGDLTVTELPAPPVELVLLVRTADQALARAYDEAVGALPDRAALVTAAGLSADDLLTAPDPAAIPSC